MALGEQVANGSAGSYRKKCAGHIVFWAVLRSPANSFTFSGLNGYPPLNPKKSRSLRAQLGTAKCWISISTREVGSLNLDTSCLTLPESCCAEPYEAASLDQMGCRIGDSRSFVWSFERVSVL